ncbi:MAG: hypothetical protein ABI142_13490, partial [Bryocella sp.]
MKAANKLCHPECNEGPAVALAFESAVALAFESAVALAFLSVILAGDLLFFSPQQSVILSAAQRSRRTCHTICPT